MSEITEATGHAGTIIILVTIHAIETRLSKVQYISLVQKTVVCAFFKSFSDMWIRLILVWQSRKMQRRSQIVVEKEGAARRFEQAGNEGMCQRRVRLLSFPLNDRLYVTKMPSTKIWLSGSFHSHLRLRDGLKIQMNYRSF